MKFTIERAALLEVAGAAQSVALSKTTIPILTHVLLEAGERRLQLSATDMDVAIRIGVEANVAVPGATTLPAAMLHDIARRAPEGSQIQIELDAESPRATVRVGRSRFVLGTLPAADFPVWQHDTAKRFAIGATVLRELLDRTRFAAARDGARTYLIGVYLHPAERDGVRVLRAVASDGNRLALCETAAPPEAQSAPGVMLPLGAVNTLCRLLDGAEGDVDVAMSETVARFEFGDTVFLTKLVDGAFPDYAPVIPTGNDRVVTVDAAAFRAMIERVTLVADDRDHSIAFRFDQRAVMASARSAKGREAEEELEIFGDAAGLMIGFNSRYLIEHLGALDADTVEVALRDAASPALLRVPGMPNVLHVLAPVAIKAGP